MRYPVVIKTHISLHRSMQLWFWFGFQFDNKTNLWHVTNTWSQYTWAGIHICTKNCDGSFLQFLLSNYAW